MSATAAMPPTSAPPAASPVQTTSSGPNVLSVQEAAPALTAPASTQAATESPGASSSAAPAAPLASGPAAPPPRPTSPVTLPELRPARREQEMIDQFWECDEGNLQAGAYTDLPDGQFKYDWFTERGGPVSDLHLTRMLGDFLSAVKISTAASHPTPGRPTNVQCIQSMMAIKLSKAVMDRASAASGFALEKLIHALQTFTLPRPAGIRKIFLNFVQNERTSPAYHVRRGFDNDFGPVKAKYDNIELEKMLRLFVDKMGSASHAIDVLLWYWMHAVNFGVDIPQADLVKALEQHITTIRMHGQVEEVRHNFATFAIVSAAKPGMPHVPGLTAMYASSHAAALLETMRIERQGMMDLFEGAVRASHSSTAWFDALRRNHDVPRFLVYEDRIVEAPSYYDAGCAGEAVSAMTGGFIGSQDTAKKLQALLSKTGATAAKEPEWLDFPVQLQVADIFHSNDATRARRNPVHWTTGVMPGLVGPLPPVPDGDLPPVIVPFVQPDPAVPAGGAIAGPAVPTPAGEQDYVLPAGHPEPIMVDSKSLVVIPLDAGVQEKRVVRFAVPAGRYVLHAWAVIPEDETVPPEPTPVSWDVPPKGAMDDLGKAYKQIWVAGEVGPKGGGTGYLIKKAIDEAVAKNKTIAWTPAIMRLTCEQHNSHSMYDEVTGIPKNYVFTVLRDYKREHRVFNGVKIPASVRRYLPVDLRDATTLVHITYPMSAPGTVYDNTCRAETNTRALFGASFTTARLHGPPNSNLDDPAPVGGDGARGAAATSSTRSTSTKPARGRRQSRAKAAAYVDVDDENDSDVAMADAPAPKQRTSRLRPAAKSVAIVPTDDEDDEADQDKNEDDDENENEDGNDDDELAQQSASDAAEAQVPSSGDDDEYRSGSGTDSSSSDGSGSGDEGDEDQLDDDIIALARLPSQRGSSPASRIRIPTPTLAAASELATTAGPEPQSQPQPQLQPQPEPAPAPAAAAPVATAAAPAAVPAVAAVLVPAPAPPPAPVPATTATSSSASGSAPPVPEDVVPPASTVAAVAAMAAVPDTPSATTPQKDEPSGATTRGRRKKTTQSASGAAGAVGPSESEEPSASTSSTTAAPPPDGAAAPESPSAGSRFKRKRVAADSKDRSTVKRSKTDPAPVEPRRSGRKAKATGATAAVASGSNNTDTPMSESAGNEDAEA